MHPILFHIGSYPVRAYGLAVALAVIGSSLFATWLGRRRNVPWVEQYSDFTFWALTGGLIGSRVWEVVANWPYYGAHLAEIPAVWEGGVSIQGAILGGFVAAWIYTRAHKIPLARFADEAAPALLFGQAIGRLLGCTLNGCAFGKPTGTSWGIVHAPGTNAHHTFGVQPLWPAEVFEGAMDLVLMAVMLRLGANRGPAGRHFALYVMLYSTGRFFLEFLRADMPRFVGGLTAAQLSSLALVAGGALWIAVQTWTRRSNPPVIPS